MGSPLPFLYTKLLGPDPGALQFRPTLAPAIPEDSRWGVGFTPAAPHRSGQEGKAENGCGSSFGDHKGHGKMV